MRTKKLFLSIIFISAVATAYAIPARPVKKTVKTTDGKTVELTLQGDEHFSFYTDGSGRCYRLRADGFAVPASGESVTEEWTSRKQERLKLMKPRLTAPQATQRRISSSATTGKHRGLVILMEFQDVKFQTADPKTVFQNFFNKEGYSDYGMSGSVHDYFYKQSYGQLEVDFDVVGPYTTKYNMEYYGAPIYNNDGEESDHDRNPYGMVAEGVDAASKEVDFSIYDWNQDGEVDQVFVIYAGYAQAQGADPNTIWPHEWVLAAGNLTKKYNGVTINTYGCSSELRGSSGKNLDGIGSACHEFSHCLGLPDMYDTSYSGGYGMANWDVMCAGNYNNNSRTPAGYTAFERWYSGWMTPTEINSLTRVKDMKPLVEEPEAYILYNEGNRNEYYLLENRQPIGFDAGLNGHGLLIVHVDYDKNAWLSNSVNTNSRQRMTIIPADDELSYSVRSIEGDTWPGLSGNTMLTNFTKPAAEVYNKNTDGTKFMNKNIDNITENTATHTVSFVACRPDLKVPDVQGSIVSLNGNGFTMTWPEVSGAVGYELELTQVGAAATDPAEALEKEFDFSSFYSATNGFSDKSSSMGSMGLSGWSGNKLYTSPKKMKIGTASTAGFVRTPAWNVPQSSDITIVMGAEPGTEGEAVKVLMSVAFYNKGDNLPSYDDKNFTVATNGKQVFNFTILKDYFWVEIHPEDIIYLNYLAIYDGKWTEEQLSGGSSAPALRRASTTNYYTTTTNSYTVASVEAESRFIYRIRTIGEENTYSQWSESKTFTFTPTAITGIETDEQAPIRYYDLSGREVDASARGVIIMKQGSRTKKLVR